MDEAWTSADAWVFAAISSERPGEARSLADVIKGADALNQAVLLEEEFTQAVGRLIAAGLVGADPVADRYWMAEAGLPLRRRWRGGRFDWMNTIPAGLERLGAPADGAFGLPDGVFRAAVDAYLRAAADGTSR